MSVESGPRTPSSIAASLVLHQYLLAAPGRRSCGLHQVPGRTTNPEHEPGLTYPAAAQPADMADLALDIIGDRAVWTLLLALVPLSGACQQD